jgi:hypothetical protein
MWWNTILVLVCVDQGPDNVLEGRLEGRRTKSRRGFVDAFSHEEETSLFPVPDDRFSLRKTST